MAASSPLKTKFKQMKKIIFIYIILLLNAGCKKSEELKLNFSDRPEVRMENAIRNINSTLNSGTNGWIATLPTLDGGGYGFYMDFDTENQLVGMYGDLTNQSANVIRESTYRFKQDMGAMLVFDTENYISFLNSPISSVFGGVSGTGYKSDIEFIYDRSTTDTLIFRGKKYRQKFVLVKATAEQRQRYMNGGYQPAIDDVKNFFVNTVNPYIEVPSGGSTLKVGIEINSTNNMERGKRISFTGILADGTTVKSSNAKFAFVLDGINLLDEGLVWEGITFVRFKLINNTTGAVYDSNGKEYIVNSSNVPIAPLSSLWGKKYSGFYTSHSTLTPAQSYPGTSAYGTDLLNTFHNNARYINGYAYERSNLVFTWDLVNHRLKLEAKLYFTSISAVINTTTYTYTVDNNGVYRFLIHTPSEGSANAGSISRNINNFMLENRVKLDYHSAGGQVYLKMTSMENSDRVMTFNFQDL